MTAIRLIPPPGVQAGDIVGPSSGTVYTLGADRMLDLTHRGDILAFLGAGWDVARGALDQILLQLAGSITGVSAPIATANAIVASGGALSGAVDLGSAALVGVRIPGSIDGATKITFQVNYEGSTFSNFYDGDGNEYAITVAADRAVKIPLGDFMGAKAIKLRLGTAAAPVNATAARTLLLSLRP